MLERKVVHFDSGDRHNAEVTLQLVKEAAVGRNIKSVIATSETGFSAEKAMEIFRTTDINLTIVGINIEVTKSRSFFENLEDLDAFPKETLGKLGRSYASRGEITF